ncbi:penicillin-binding protein 2 [Sediminibacterium sp.]|jgi:penicillin-binding protein 2|uniref:penicillin-binding protein 2 n=1 Tax=Sediminibacterium sp. TaxID=1917865 RepID=UPI00272F0D03|nr:penicillin-binding protein 2 [Sediminibacterium sp.]MDP1971483.1 penicillin-binding protein 2 [Sediminibacterium sp.]MDP2422466.1 penicillin-binding protein 2 [Sediminibacterium sp.]
MSVFNQSRGRIIQIIIGVVFIVITAQLINLQIFSSQYKLAAENNAIYRKIIYPDRGIIFDRKKRALLENTISFDLIVTPAESKGTDTASLCAILGIDTAEYKKRMLDLIFKNTRVRPSVFEPLLSAELYAKLTENMYKFPGFVLSERSVRTYPFNTAAQLLGYIAEVDTSYLRKNKHLGYEMGDYAGMSGLEKTYESILMGQRGIKRFIRDNKSRIQGAYENGIFDTIPVAGRNLFTSIDVEVQQLAEQLLQNKIGSAVAINPRTGGIITMVSSPTYNPNVLTGNARRKNWGRMVMDTAKPMYNRAIKGQYPPGSTFKPLGALVALDQGLITSDYGIGCSGGYGACGGVYVRCEHSNAGHAANLRLALANSCNSYFSDVFRKALDNKKWGNTNQGYLKWKEYMNAFGLGRRLEVDLPSEDKANIPDTSIYNKFFGGARRWNSCSVLTLGIGQDKMTATPLQMANLMCIIANRGYYFPPHFVDSIENEQVEDTVLMNKYRKKHVVTNISDNDYQAVNDGMHDVTVYGTASHIKIPGIEYCAKTGTAQNPHGKNHSLFVAFAPKDNPRIAVAVVVENGGYGSVAAGPIAGLIMEKFLNDTLSTAGKATAERLTNMNLIPEAIKNWYTRKDAERAARLAKLALEEAAEKEEAENSKENNKSNTEATLEQGSKPVGNKKDSTDKYKIKAALLLSEDKKKRLGGRAQ